MQEHRCFKWLEQAAEFVRVSGFCQRDFRWRNLNGCGMERPCCKSGVWVLTMFLS